MSITSFLKSLAVAAALIPALVIAQSPVGTWKTIDDNTGKAKSLVIITDEQGVLSGKVSKIIDPTKRDMVCSKCKDERKNQKIEGMIIIWNMEKKGGKYDNGKIVDPESGKIYSANMKLLNQGKKLEVRGYVGFSLLGRSQIWERVE